MSTSSRTRRRIPGPIVAVLVTVAVLATVAGLWAFQPWKVLTSSTVDEALPTVAAEQPTATPTAPGQSQPQQPQPPAEPTVLAEGSFVSQEHDTNGAAKILRLADGSRVLRLEGFSTSDGPDVHVWLTDQPAGGGWNSYDDGRFVKLGKLKATNGNQNYPIPADADLAGLRSVAIWCDRFNVAFGSAALAL